MKRQNRILAGTALATLMMTASAGFAFAVPNAAPLRVSQPLVYAQADVEDPNEAKKKKRKAEQRKESREKAAEDSRVTKKQAQAKRKQRTEQENAAADDSQQPKATKKQSSAKKKRQAEEAARQADADGDARRSAKSKQARAEQVAAKKQAVQAAAKRKQQSATAKALPVAALAQVPADEPRSNDEEQGKAASRKLAQAEGQESGEVPTEEQPIRKKRNAEQAPAEKAAPQQQEAAPEQQREEAAPEPQPEQAAPEPQPEQAAPAEEPQREEAPAEQRQEAAPAEESQPKQAAPAEEPQREEAAPAEEPQREEAAPAEESRPRKARPAQEEAAPAEKPKRRKQAAEEPSGESAPAEQPAEPKPEAPADQPAEAEQPAKSSPEQPAEASPQGEAIPNEQPSEATPSEPRQPAEAEAAPDDGKAAPVLDSQKRRPRGDGTREGRRDRDKRPAGEGTETAAPEPEAVPAGPPPADDRAAQEAAQPKEIKSVTAERGTRRRDRSPDDDEPRRRERPEGSRVLREIGDRVVIQFNNQVIVESNDRPRMSRGAREVYYEDLPRGRTREIIVRRDGTQVVTVRNAYGDVIRRSRIAPDGQEYVLAYVDDGYYDRVRDWRDPGDDLPPMQLDVPIEEYIFDATTAEEPEAYYEFLEQPPVERVERLYSVDEVKRSARIRDKTRRIDMDTLTFEFGSASIAEDQIAKLDGVAQAMEKILAKNPAETFLIEGHTDAVGSDLANLALSDRRAEAVADALSNVFAIPPENLATQGYGEQYLKVRTQAPERENRRVAIRRITPLVAPVASAQ